MAYKHELKDERWDLKRAEIIARDKCCQHCTSKQNFQIHHKYYLGNRNPWEYENDALILLCDVCHEKEEYNLKQSAAAFVGILRVCGFMYSDIKALCNEVVEVNSKGKTPAEIIDILKGGG